MNTYNLQSDGALATNSSGGKLLKWKVGNTFIKTSSYVDSTITPTFLYESYAEVIAYHLATWLNIPHVKYSLCGIVIDNSYTTVACECADFRPNGFTYTSIGKLMLEGLIPVLPMGRLESYQTLLSCIQVPGFKRYIDNQIILDYLVLNDDRHFGNLGLLAGKGGEYKIPLIFDTGNSLFCHKFIDNLVYTPELSGLLKAKPFSLDFDTQLKLISTSSIIIPDNIETRIARLLAKLEALGLPIQRADFIYRLLMHRLNIVCNI